MIDKDCLSFIALILAAPAVATGSQLPCPTEVVPDSAPSSIDNGLADSLFARSNFVSLLPERSDSQPRNVVLLAFSRTATHEQRQVAVHSVCGKVFGGAAGFYLVKVQTDGTGAGLWRVIRRLRGQRGVRLAEPNLPEVSPLKEP